jgi:hypothetical protein
MLDYKSIKEYWSKFYADAFEDAKSILERIMLRHSRTVL